MLWCENELAATRSYRGSYSKLEKQRRTKEIISPKMLLNALKEI
jgi:hypothetical protein